MRKNITPEEQALNKLARPVHISYICGYILKSSMEECVKTINQWVEEGLIKESEYGEGYYVRTNDGK